MELLTLFEQSGVNFPNAWPHKSMGKGNGDRLIKRTQFHLPQPLFVVINVQRDDQLQMAYPIRAPRLVACYYSAVCVSVQSIHDHTHAGFD